MEEIVTVSELDVLGNTLDSFGHGRALHRFHHILKGYVELTDRGFLGEQHRGSGFEHRLLVSLSCVHR